MPASVGEITKCGKKDSPGHVVGRILVPGDTGPDSMENARLIVRFDGHLKRLFQLPKVEYRGELAVTDHLAHILAYANPRPNFLDSGFLQPALLQTTQH